MSALARIMAMCGSSQPRIGDQRVADGIPGASPAACSDFVSQFALDRAAMLIERVETAEQLASVLRQRRYSCLPNYIKGDGHERMLIEQLALDHPC